MPFIIGDLLLLAAASVLVWKGARSNDWTALFILAPVAIGAWLAAWPFVLQFRADVKAADNRELTSAMEQIRNLEVVARQIASATNEWQHVHQSATHAVTTAEHIAERMTAEARNFDEILTRVNDTEKNHLRLELDKLRRTEADWLQLVVRILDNVHALYQAGVRSGQRNLVDQLGSFQNACRDAARRVGLVPIVPETGKLFDPKQHQLFEGQNAKEGSVVGDILAPGYTFQSQLVRLPVVTVIDSNPAAAEAEPEAQLSFGDQS